uniref:Uncharacterized protein n=1 Tax=Romanomermis culicivorax TaxID=13658 RepID=A0A915JAS1_ROMCU
MTTDKLGVATLTTAELTMINLTKANVRIVIALKVGLVNAVDEVLDPMALLLILFSLPPPLARKPPTAAERIKLR